MRYVFLDIETKKIFDDVGGYFPEKLGVSFAGVCVRDGQTGPGEMRGFFEEELKHLFPILEQADVVVGFNSDGFDLPALVPYYSGDIGTIPSLDILSRIKASAGHRIGLDAVAKATLGVGKSGDGLDAIRYFQTGNRKALSEYCLQDVAVTRDVFDHGVTRGSIKFYNKWNRLIECPVDFSFKPRSAGFQMSLL